MARGLGHLAAHMKDFIKNGSQIKILKIPQILMKIFKYSILDNMYQMLPLSNQYLTHNTPKSRSHFSHLNMEKI